ncbi:MAG: ABC transporter permease [Gammaproteobacteria bacterium]|nr:ABC transporter permease [Gammaproteobacteria bacterium]MBT8111961.1 ABC transporter permease [Gammaproteobacteria bacterium]NND48337.1 ABC transporter permease [Woeseiaceae bacterium]NNL46661.1 ABC transporter permease [Woeseiaceae bacterium]
MKYFRLIWKNAWRKKIRTSLTILSVFVAFLLFALLSAIGFAFRGGVDVADAERLIIIDKVSLINPLPMSYMNRVAATDGVESVTHASWFGGYYQEPRNQFGQFPVDPQSYFDMYPEFKMPAEQFEAFKRNRTGAVVGQELAKTYGWKVGDQIPIQATIWTKADGGRTWEFQLEGIFSTDDPRGSTALMLFQYDYFEEARAFAKGTVGWYILRVAKGADPIQVAKAIDLQFANSPNETETSTEAAFAQSFTKQFGNIALIVTLILGAVFFTLLLVSGNTMSQSVREKIPELAVLKTLGFGDRTVLGIVLSESILIMLLGGLLGLGTGWLFVQGLAKGMAAFLPGVYLSPAALAGGVAMMIGAGILAGIFPALKAMRLSIIEALARS